MARRVVGQERLAMGGERQAGRTLEEVAALIDWTELDGLLVCISASAKGQQGWPPLALLCALLLANWHDLSDLRLAAALDDHASLRRFRGFAVHEGVDARP